MSHCKNKQIIILHFLKGPSMPAHREENLSLPIGLWASPRPILWRHRPGEPSRTHRSSTVEPPSEALACLAFHLIWGRGGSRLCSPGWDLHKFWTCLPSHLRFFLRETGVLDTLWFCQEGLCSRIPSALLGDSRHVSAQVQPASM